MATTQTSFNDQNPEQPSDYSGLYASDGPNPAEDLTQQLSAALKQSAASASTGTTTGAAQQAQPAAPAPAAASAPKPATPAPTTGGAPQQPSYLAPSAKDAALLGRLAPMGVKSLSDLRGKTEDQLRKLSADVVSYETRQNMMRTNFSQRADGTFDLTKDASGNPTGLDAQGKSLYNQQPVVPAPTTPKPPATPAKPAAKPKPKPAAKPKPKPAAKKKVTAKPAPKKKPAAKKPAPKPAAKKPAPKPAVKKPATKVTSTYRVSATGTGHGM